VLCPLLWVTLLGQGAGLGDPQRSLPFCGSVIKHSGEMPPRHVSGELPQVSSLRTCQPLQGLTHPLSTPPASGPSTPELPLHPSEALAHCEHVQRNPRPQGKRHLRLPRAPCDRQESELLSRCCFDSYLEMNDKNMFVPRFRNNKWTREAHEHFWNLWHQLYRVVSTRNAIWCFKKQGHISSLPSVSWKEKCVSFYLGYTGG